VNSLICRSSLMSSGRRLGGAIVLMLAILAAPAQLAAVPYAGHTPPGTVRLIVVEKPGVKEPLDLAALGGKIEQVWATRKVIVLPEAAVAALQQHPRVHYIQRLLPVDEVRQREASEPGTSPAAGSGSGDAASAAVSSPAVRSSSTTDTMTLGPYEYDGSGNIHTIGGAGGASSFRYDRFGRLTNATVVTPNGVSHGEAYTYDKFGNMQSRGSLTIQVDPATNRLSPAMGTSYDVAGNLTQYGGKSYSIDPFNMAVQVQSHTVNDVYIYTASDERIGVRHQNEGKWRWTIRDFEGKVQREYESADAVGSPWLWVEDYIYREGQLVAAEKPPQLGGIRYFHLDHLGTPRLITSQSGVRISEHHYLPFGEELTSIRQEVIHGWQRDEPMKFTGHERDFLGGLHDENKDYHDYMHARYYSPTLGRFLSVDPAPDSVSLMLPQTWNRYSYVLNNPLNNIDPDGRCTMTLHDGSTHVDDSIFCVDVNAPRWTSEDIRARQDAAHARAVGEFLAWSAENTRIAVDAGRMTASQIGQSFAAFGDGVLGGSGFEAAGLYNGEEYGIARTSGEYLNTIATGASLAFGVGEVRILGAEAWKRVGIWGNHGRHLRWGETRHGGYIYYGVRGDIVDRAASLYLNKQVQGYHVYLWAVRPDRR
jgi:RHS repeat-associated protein